MKKVSLIKGGKNLKIAISATGRGLGSNIDVKFERCSFFIILDIGENSLLSFENKKKDSPHEIGGAIGPLIAKEGIDTVITKDIGPTAFDIFKRYGIKIYQAEGIVEEAVRRLKEGRLKELKKPTVPRYSYWKKKQ